MLAAFEAALMITRVRWIFIRVGNEIAPMETRLVGWRVILARTQFAANHWLLICVVVVAVVVIG